MAAGQAWAGARQWVLAMTTNSLKSRSRNEETLFGAKIGEMQTSQTDLNETLVPVLQRMGALVADMREAMLTGVEINRAVFFCAETGDELDVDPAAHLAQAMGDWNCLDDEAAGAVARYPGVVEVSPALFQTVQELNAEKGRLEMLVTSFNVGQSRFATLRRAYALAGYPRLHPLMAWRRVFVIDAPVLSAGFTVATKGASSELLTREEVLTRLNDANASDLAAEVSGFGDGCQYRWHEPVKRHLRCNLSWGADGEVIRRQMPANLPFVVLKGCWPSKRIRFNPGRSHQERSDKIRGIRLALPFRDGGYLSVTDATLP